MFHFPFKAAKIAVVPQSGVSAVFLSVAFQATRSSRNTLLSLAATADCEFRGSPYGQLPSIFHGILAYS